MLGSTLIRPAAGWNFVHSRSTVAREDRCRGVFGVLTQLTLDTKVLPDNGGDGR